MPTPLLLAARAGEPDRYLAALLAPRARARRPAGAGGVLGRDRPRALRRRQRADHRRDPPAVVARCAGARPAAARTGIPVADALRAAAERHDLARALCSRHDRCALAATSAARCLADDAALRDYLWKSEGALFALAARVVARRARRSATRRCRGGVRPRLRSGAPAAGVAAGAVARAHAVAAIAARAGRRRAEQTCWPATPASALPSLLAGLRAECRAAPCHEPATCGEFAARDCAPLSFLWPWSSPICGHWNGRAATSCAARSRSCRSRGSSRIAMAHWLGRM